jgi:hypothetical protein
MFENSKDAKSIGRSPYVIGGLSFIPLIGVPFGIIAIIIGFVYYNKGGKSLIVVGVGGILFTVMLFGGTYFAFKEGKFNEVRIKMAKMQLTSLVENIEFYKLLNGNYPQSLEALKISMPKEKPIFFYDSTQFNLTDRKRKNYFYYELITDGKAYYLLGIGPDKKPFTEDDILPEVEMSKLNNIGLRFHPGSIKK